MERDSLGTVGIFIFLCAVLASSAALYAQTDDDAFLVRKYTPQVTRDFRIRCVCRANFNGLTCEFNGWDKIAQKQRQTWVQFVSGIAGTEIDISAACYRKRNVEQGGGEGMCCEEQNNEGASLKYYSARILD